MRRILGEMVALTVAEAGGLHGGEALQFGAALSSNKTTRAGWPTGACCGGL